MSQNDLLSSALSKIHNAEKVAKRECEVKSSKMIKKVLEIMNEKGYIGGFKQIDDGKGGLLLVSLIGKVNKCGGVKPRYPLKVDDFEKFEKRYLIAKGFGMLIISTTKGIMTHDDAKKNNLGGKLLAYCY
ncbi:MAG: 30S ribosomal protein S8 [Candidatus Woesearchaeota archaeon]|nr:30S ribosomal protein S8 [Candidatus Woesearchaeota archaeon]